MTTMSKIVKNENGIEIDKNESNNHEEKEYLCRYCQMYVRSQEEENAHVHVSVPSKSDNTTVAGENSSPEEIQTKQQHRRVCCVCLNIWEGQSSLEDAIVKASEPYGGMQVNRFCMSLLNHAPTLSFAGDIFLRYQHYVKNMKEKSESTQRTTISNRAKPYSIFLQDLKQHLQQQIEKIITKHQKLDSSSPMLPPILSNDEQQGYLSLHVLSIPTKGQSIRDHSPHITGKKRKRSKYRAFMTQGGDPRVNLEQRLQTYKGYKWFSSAEAESMTVSSSASTTHLNFPTTKEGLVPIEFHVAVFRRPIYLYGYYTKSRRDISQSPFIVYDNKEGEQNGDTMGKTLGASSVEEEICRPIQDFLGISNQNEGVDPNMRYGMCKFHASGREDMDVRMLIRPQKAEGNDKNGKTESVGRPFCIQIIDSLRRLSSQGELDAIVKKINGGDGETSPLWYGSNPLGVGIAPTFRIVPASTFSGLQADTESKIKHYGCHCWSERKLPLDWKFSLSNLRPLTIQQRTPLRVIHRRANLTRERQILDATGVRVDDHHFRLELSTSAGTYVKEFVHGDLRRTTPSMSSILETKTNLLLLDCEGIQLNIG